MKLIRILIILIIWWTFILSNWPLVPGKIEQAKRSVCRPMDFSDWRIWTKTKAIVSVVTVTTRITSASNDGTGKVELICSAPMIVPSLFQNHFHLLSTGRAGESISTNTLSRCFHEVNDSHSLLFCSLPKQCADWWDPFFPPFVSPSEILLYYSNMYIHQMNANIFRSTNNERIDRFKSIFFRRKLVTRAVVRYPFTSIIVNHLSQTK